MVPTGTFKLVRFTLVAYLCQKNANLQFRANEKQRFYRLLSAEKLDFYFRFYVQHYFNLFQNIFILNKYFGVSMHLFLWFPLKNIHSCWKVALWSKQIFKAVEVSIAKYFFHADQNLASNNFWGNWQMRNIGALIYLFTKLLSVLSVLLLVECVSRTNHVLPIESFLFFNKVVNNL